MKFLKILIFLVLTFQSAIAQLTPTANAHFEQITVNQGLSENAVVAIHKDRLGYMWFGTRNGIVRHDGVDYKIYNKNPENKDSYKGGICSTIFEDKAGRMWIGGQYGLTLFNRDKENFTLYLPEPDSTSVTNINWVNRIVQDMQNQFWLVTHPGNLYRFNPETKQFQRFGKQNGFTNAMVECWRQNFTKNGIFLSDNKTLYISTYNGLFACNTSDLTFKQWFAKYNIISMLEDASGAIWVATWKHGAKRLNPRTGKYDSFGVNSVAKHRINNDTVLSIFRDVDNCIWLTTRSEFFRYNPKLDSIDQVVKLFPAYNIYTYWPFILDSDKNNGIWALTHYYKNERMPVYYNTKNKQITYFNFNTYFGHLTSFYKDITGNYWFGTAGTGLFSYNPGKNRFPLYKHKKIPDNVNVISFYENDQFLFLGTEKGLYLINKQNDAVLLFDKKNGMVDDAVFALWLDPKNNLWVGSNKGAYILDINTMKITPLIIKDDKQQWLQKYRINCFVHDKNNAIWMGSFLGGIAKLTPDTENGQIKYRITIYQNNKKDTNSLTDNMVSNIIQDKKGRIWVASHNALSLYNETSDNFQRVTNNEFMSIANMIEYKSKIYIATYRDGLLLLDQETKKIIKRYNRENTKLPENWIQGLVLDKNENLWLNTEMGLCFFDPKNETYRLYTHQDGLPEINVKSINLYNNSNNYIYYSGLGQMVKFHPDSIYTDTVPPKLIITALKLHNKLVLPGNTNSVLKNLIEETQQISLKYNQNVITLNYAAIHYVNPEEIEYAYMLEGVEKNWQYVGKLRTANYSGLPPGTYTFYLKAKNCDGIWNKKGIQLIIIIRPPWWKTVWFRTVLVFIIISFIFLYIKWRITKIRNQNKTLENLVKERTFDLSEANQEINLQNEELKAANEQITMQKDELELTVNNLKKTQAELILSEKMASLGQLIAGIAHEINTPIGAISGSASNITENINQSIRILPELVKTLSNQNLNLVINLIEQSTNATITATLREQRTYRFQLASELENNSVENPEYIADILIDMGIYNRIEKYIPILTNPDKSILQLTLNAAYHLSMLAKNTQNIKMAVDRVSKVVFALKSYARFSDEDMMIEANLIDGIETVLTLYTNQLKQGINLTKQFTDIPKIRCNPDQLNQVWTNLIHNAIQAMQGKGNLTIAVSINPNAFISSAGITIAISDTGCGIAPENIDKVFDAFFTTKPAGEGSGLGLHIVKQIIDKHGGQIYVTSKPGTGTTVTVKLPEKQ